MHLSLILHSDSGLRFASGSVELLGCEGACQPVGKIGMPSGRAMQVFEILAQPLHLLPEHVFRSAVTGPLPLSVVLEKGRRIVYPLHLHLDRFHREVDLRSFRLICHV